jgi:transcriptional regulator with GAF, ATPase, and Fis domain
VRTKRPDVSLLWTPVGRTREAGRPESWFVSICTSPRAAVKRNAHGWRSGKGEFTPREIEENHWNMTRTAAALGLERSHLYRKMKTLGIAAEMS